VITANTIKLISVHINYIFLFSFFAVCESLYTVIFMVCVVMMLLMDSISCAFNHVQRCSVSFVHIIFLVTESLNSIVDNILIQRCIKYV
jgi:hypothetical protein